MAVAGPLLALIAGGYLIGSLLPAEWLVRRRTGRSPGDLGDNPGGAGAWRLAGPRAAVLTTLFDMAKGALPLVAAQATGFGDILGLGPLWRSAPAPGPAVGPSPIGSGWIQGLALAAVACAPIAGHNWPAFHRFRGGRGLSTSVGVLLYLAFAEMLPALALGVAVAFSKRWVPLIGIVAFPVGIALMIARGVALPRVVAALAVALTVLVRQAPWVWTHLGRRQGGKDR